MEFVKSKINCNSSFQTAILPPNGEVSDIPNPAASAAGTLQAPPTGSEGEEGVAVSPNSEGQIVDASIEASSSV